MAVTGGQPPLSAGTQAARYDRAGPQPVILPSDRDPTALPATLAPFIGRDGELSSITSILGEARLVTLVGPGGIGKTRLALEVAAGCPDSGCGLGRPRPGRVADMVGHAVLQALGLAEPAGRSPVRPLAAQGETVWRVPGLAVPPAAAGPELLARCDAVRLFVDRARRQLPDFAVGQQELRVISHICRQLDGVPLAIELAAARVRVLSVEEISDLLRHSV